MPLLPGFYEETLEIDLCGSAWRWESECQRQAVRIIVSSDEWEGCHCSNRRAFSGLATRTGGSPVRRGAATVGTAWPPTSPTLAITSSTDAPLPVPTLMARLSSPRWRYCRAQMCAEARSVT